MTYQSNAAKSEQIQEVFVALSDNTRRSIFESLRSQPMSVGEIAKKQPVSRPAVSQHLKVLESANLVTATPEGTRRLYAVKREGLADLRNYLNQFWSDILTAYSVQISKEMKSKNKNRNRRRK